MQTYWPLDFGVWRELLLVLTVGATAIVGAAAAAAACLRTAAWQRTIWQAAVIGLLTLVAVEVSGMGRGLVRWCFPSPAVHPSADGNAKATANSVGRAALPRGNWYLIIPGGTGTMRSADPAIENLPDKTGQFARVGPRPVVAPGRNRPLPTIGVDSSAKAPAAQDRTPEFAFWPGAIWAAGTLALLARLGWAGAVLVVFRRRRPSIRDESLRRRVDALARQVGLRRPVRVLAAKGLRVPVAFGIFRPSIALPEAFAEHYDSQQQQAMLAHELAHLAAGDPAAQWLANLACAVLWWHPAAWWSRRQLRAASEAAADEASLLVPGGPDLLADCLVKLGRRLKHPAELGWLSIQGGGFRSALGRRVERLWNLKTRSWQAPGRGRLLVAKAAVAGSLVCVAVSCTAWAQSQAPMVPLREGETTMSIFTRSWRSSLAASALWALLGPAPTDAVAQSAPENPPVAEKQPGIKVTPIPDGEIHVTIAEVDGKDVILTDVKQVDVKQVDVAKPADAVRPTDVKPSDVEKPKEYIKPVEAEELRRLEAADVKAGKMVDAKPKDAESRKIDAESRKILGYFEAADVKAGMMVDAKPKEAESRKMLGLWLQETQTPQGKVLVAVAKPAEAADPKAGATNKAAIRERIQRQRDLAEKAWQICQKIDSLADSQNDQAQALRVQLEQVEAELGQTLGGRGGTNFVARTIVSGGSNGDTFYLAVPSGAANTIDFANGKGGNAVWVQELPQPGGNGAKAGITIVGPANFGPAPDRETLFRRAKEIEQKMEELRLNKEDRSEEMQRIRKELDQLHFALKHLSYAPQPGQPNSNKPAADNARFVPTPGRPGAMAASDDARYVPQPGQPQNYIVPGQTNTSYFTLKKSDATPPARPDAVVALQKQVQDMQRQMEDMRAMLKKMSEGQEKMKMGEGQGKQ